MNGEARVPTTPLCSGTRDAFGLEKTAEFSTGCADASECAGPLAWLHWNVSGAIRASGSIQKDTKMRKQQGFTLIELMIVVAIIGILASVSIPLYSDYSSRSRAAAAKAELSGVKTAVGLCIAEAAKLEECKAGEFGIPRSLTETSNVIGGYAVASGVIEAETGATDSDGNALTIKLTPKKEKDSGNITWTESGTICNADRGLKPGAGDCPKSGKTES